MNRRQRAVLIGALIIVAIVLLFPPWNRTMVHIGRETVLYQGYHWIGSPMYRHSRIDLTSLLWSLGVICAMALLAYLELQDGPREENGACD